MNAKAILAACLIAKFVAGCGVTGSIYFIFFARISNNFQKNKVVSFVRDFGSSTESNCDYHL